MLTWCLFVAGVFQSKCGTVCFRIRTFAVRCPRTASFDDGTHKVGSIVANCHLFCSASEPAFLRCAFHEPHGKSCLSASNSSRRGSKSWMTGLTPVLASDRGCWRCSGAVPGFSGRWLHDCLRMQCFAWFDLGYKFCVSLRSIPYSLRELVYYGS